MDEHGDFLFKIRQIEELAFTAGGDAQVGSAKNHLRQIGLAARALRMRLEMGVAQVVATAPAREPNDPGKEGRA